MWGRCRAVSVARRAYRTRPVILRLAIPAASAAALVLASGCGGGTRQDAHEPSGSFAMEVTGASFPVKQSIARPSSFSLRVHNAGQQTVPNVAVTLDSFYYTATFPELASNKRPVWVVETGPGGRARPPVKTQEVSTPGSAQTAYVNTWAFGALAPNQTQTFTWRVVPVKAGSYTVHYRVAAGLSGKARAQVPGGGPVQGRLSASIAPLPPSTHVDPQTGHVVAGTFPKIP